MTLSRMEVDDIPRQERTTEIIDERLVTAKCAF